jgi:GNAT superfamily N-acetyltransferase
MWTDVRTSERYRQNRVAVAERDDVYAADHGTGAGRALLEAVINPAEPAALWVADPNPRAQAFYRKHGFAADGTARSGDGVREIRMVRGVQHDGTGRSRGR